jgi:hypothetical protein
MVYSAFRKKKPLAITLDPLMPAIQQMKEASGAKHNDGDIGKPNWSVLRQDDNGNVSLVKDGLTRTEALLLIAEYEAKGHKQTYWAQEST